MPQMAEAICGNYADNNAFELEIDVSSHACGQQKKGKNA